MLPDDLRKENEELEFLKRWADKLPQKIVFDGKPFRLQRPSVYPRNSVSHLVLGK